MKKGNVNLLLMAGDADVGDDYVRSHGFLLPELTTLNPSLSPSSPFNPPPVVDVRTNTNIIEGEFKCNFTIEGTLSFFSINLWTGNDHLLIRINEHPHFCSIKKYQNDSTVLVGYAGSSTAISLGEKTSMGIKINSSFITIMINDIVVLTQWFLNNGVSVGINVYGPSPVKIENIDVVEKKPKVFVVMQFQDSYNELYEEVIKPICHDYGLDVTRADESVNNGSVIKDILAELTESTLVVADITPDNPNVYYEVGYAHAIRKDVILLCNEQRTRLPFDLADFRTVFYKDTIAGHSQIKVRLRKHLEDILKNNKKNVLQ